MNNTVLVGRMTKDPELKFAQGTGTAVCTFTIAVNRSFKKEGQPDADFIPIVVFGKQAEATANYMSKGSQVGVVGCIQTRNYEAKDGNKRYVTEIIAEHVEFLDSKGSKEETYDSNKNESRFPTDVKEVEDCSDIPF